MKTTLLLALLSAVLLSVTGCDTKKDQPEDENVLKYQMDTLDKAKEVEGMLQEVEKKRREEAMGEDQ